jgi:hypothetical protein
MSPNHLFNAIHFFGHCPGEDLPDGLDATVATLWRIELARALS